MSFQMHLTEGQEETYSDSPSLAVAAIAVLSVGVALVVVGISRGGSALRDDDTVTEASSGGELLRRNGG